MVEGIEHHDKGSHERVEEVLSAMDVRFELLNALRNRTPIPDFRIYARARNTTTWYPVLEATYARVKRSPLLQGGGDESSLLLEEDEEDGESSTSVGDSEEDEAAYIFEPIDGNEVVGRALRWVTKPTKDEHSVALHVSRVLGASFDQCEFKLEELASG